MAPTELLWTAALLGLFLQLVVYLAHAAAILAYPFDLDQGEGYDVYAGRLLALGRPIYTDNEQYPYFSSNYPPLYSAVVAAAIGIWGPQLLAGRAVSLLATLGIGVLIVLAARERGGGAGGLIAGGFFWLSNYVFHVTPLARVNALTALLALAAVLCLARDGRRWLAAGWLLLLAALFTKPTAIDAAAAGLLGLTLRQPRHGLLATSTLGVAGLTLATWLELSTGRAFSLNVLLGNVNPFLPEQLQAYLLNFGLLHAVPLALATLALTRAAARRRLGPLHLFLLSGLVMAFGVGKWGAGESYFLSAIVASSILAGERAGQLIARGGVAPAVVAGLVLLQCLVSSHGLMARLAPGLPDRGLQADALAAEPTFADLERGHGIVTRLRELPGEALAEDPGFVLAAGKSVVGNATHLRNLHEAGLWRGDQLVADITARRYHTVVLDAELYPAPVLRAIGRYYFLYDSVRVYRATQQVFLPGST